LSPDAGATRCLYADFVKNQKLRDNHIVPMIKKYGGAGIHGMFHKKRYRISFNFLEHPRVVVSLKEKKGPVQGVTFSTRRPEEVLQILQEAVKTGRKPA
jgi:hypothetical protein